MKASLKQYIPPILKKKITGLFYGWSGNFSSWEEAAAQCSGYDSEIILEKVKQALLKVKNGEAKFERDSVLFDEIDYSMPLLAALGLVATSQKQLNVLDFGGSLGSSYYQTKHFFLGHLPFTWNVVEQKHFVTTGKKDFEDEYLKFYYTIEDVLKEKPIDLLLLSSVIHYLPEPYQLLDSIFSYKIKYILIDRTPLLKSLPSRITIQKVPKNIYKAKYPCWLLNEKELLSKLSSHYFCHFNVSTPEEININNAAFKALFFELKKS